jgi:hypothetical protein
MVFRLFSGAVLACIVFIAAGKAGIEGGNAFAVAAVPLIASAINVMAGPIFLLSALSGILMIIVPMLPVSNLFGVDVVASIRGLPEQVKSSVVNPAASAPSAATALARRLADIEAACTSGALTPAACEEAKRNSIQSMSRALGISETVAPSATN